MTLYRGRYRIESARRPGWNYTTPGWYFVTLCTHRRVCVLGDVRDGRVRLSKIGRIVAEEWQRTPRVRPNVVLDAWVIMPNHLHGIVRILPRTDGAADDAGIGAGVDRARDDADVGGTVETPRRCVSTAASAPMPGFASTAASARSSGSAPTIVDASHDDHVETAGPRSRLQPGSLGAIIGQFKSMCTKRIRAASQDCFAWQTRYYDSIIRDGASLQRVRRYIAANPARWDRDRNCPEGLFM
jgi:putative transposase